MLLNLQFLVWKDRFLYAARVGIALYAHLRNRIIRTPNAAMAMIMIASGAHRSLIPPAAIGWGLIDREIRLALRFDLARGLSGFDTSTSDSSYAS